MGNGSKVVLEVLPPLRGGVDEAAPPAVGRGLSSRTLPPPPGRLVRLTAWLSGKTGRRAHQAFRVRLAVQAFFSLASILVGIQLARFYLAAKAGELPLPTRPPGVEAYLPISGLMGIPNMTTDLTRGRQASGWVSIGPPT